jgi:SSS family solute:Na+ symporter
MGDYLNYQHMITIFLTLLLVTLVGAYSGKRIKSNIDFIQGGNKAGIEIVAGTIMGTLVGGASTVGTAQMAFIYGFSAWWFTLGAGIGCFFLGTFFARPIRESGVKTVPQVLLHQYGQKAGLMAGIFTSLGMFLNIVAQIIAVVALLSAMLGIEPYPAALLAIFLMACYVVFGGVWGTGMVGMVKTLLVYFTALLSGFLALSLSGGIHNLQEIFPSYPWFSLFGRGLGKDLSAGISLVVGVLSTQTYIQAIISGKDLKTSRRGAWVSALLIPPLGLAGIFIGLYMKASFPYIEPALAFPLFVIKFLNPWVGGIVLATLLLSAIGTGAGLALGISTILTQDIYKKYLNIQADEKKILKLTRVLICLVLILALLFVSGKMQSLILQWSFLSMALRGATCFIPMTAALFFKKMITPRAGTAAIFLGPLSVILWELLVPAEIDSLVIGIIISILVMTGGSIIKIIYQ